MPALTLETREKEKSIILLLGDENSLIPSLIETYEEDFKIARISDNPSHQSDHVYTIKTSTATLIKNLEEKIDYAILFLENENVRHYIEPILEKLATDKTRVAVLVSLENLEKFYDIILASKKYNNFYFLFLGDVYSEIPDFNPGSEVSQIIESVIKERSANFSGDELKPLFPIYYKDSILGINQVLLGPAQKQKFYYLFYKNPQTYLSAIHIIERIEPDLKIEYQEITSGPSGNEREDLGENLQAKLVANPSYLDEYLEGFEKSINHFSQRGPIKEPSQKKIISIPKKIISSHKAKVKVFSTAAFFAILLFIVTNIVAGGGAVIFFKNSISSFKQGDYVKAQSDIEKVSALIEYTDPTITLVGKAASHLGFASVDQDYQILKDSVTLMSIASSDIERVKKVTEGVSRDAFDKNIADAIFLYFEAQKLATETKNEAFNVVLTPDLSMVLSLLQVAPDILGFSEERSYLLLFQNNGELRPGGGFIGSVGELKIKNGKIESFNLQDVYEYDGKLKAHIEPHYVIRRYLQPHLYLRDSNFDLDFQESASKAALLYNLETDRKPDGVIGINFEAVRKMIAQVSPIELSSYHKTLDENNAFEFLEQTIDDNFFSGSTQKKEVLQALFNGLMSKIQYKNSLLKVARIFPTLVREKQIVFAFADSPIQGVFSALNLGGDYKDLRSSKKDAVNDFIAVNEANIGVNKANVKVKRNTSYEAVFQTSKIESKITHVLDNTGGKDYVAYLRFIVSSGSALASVKINAEEQEIIPFVTDFKEYEKKNFKPPSGLEVDQEVLGDHQTFGFITTVKAGEKQEIVITYDNGLIIPDETIINYSLLLKKQSGTTTFPFELKIDYGDGLTPQAIDNATLDAGSVVLREPVSEDQEFKGRFIRR